jgi:hypothetical protein
MVNGCVACAVDANKLQDWQADPIFLSIAVIGILIVMS